MVFNGSCNLSFLGFGQAGVAERSEDTLAGLPLRIAEGFDELDDRGVLDDFGAEIHAGKNRGGRNRVSIIILRIRHYKTIFQKPFC